MSYVTHKILLISLISLYAAGGIYTGATPQGEAYPFFSWFVFSGVPPKFQVKYDARFLEFGGKTLDPPVFFKAARGRHLKDSVALPQYSYLVNLLAEAIAQNNSEDIARQRQTLEGNFISRPLVYEIIKVRFDTLEYFKTGRILEIERVAVFNVP